MRPVLSSGEATASLGSRELPGFPQLGQRQSLLQTPGTPATSGVSLMNRFEAVAWGHPGAPTSVSVSESLPCPLKTRCWPEVSPRDQIPPKAGSSAKLLGRLSVQPSLVPSGLGPVLTGL